MTEYLFWYLCDHRIMLNAFHAFQHKRFCILTPLLCLATSVRQSASWLPTARRAFLASHQGGASFDGMPTTTRRSAAVAKDASRLTIARSGPVRRSSSTDGSALDAEPSAINMGLVPVTTPSRKTATKSSDDRDRQTDDGVTHAVSPSPAKTRKRKTATANESSTVVVVPESDRKVAKLKSLESHHTPPPDWQTIYSLVEELRQDRTAPCDHSGCEALAAEGGGDPLDNATRSNSPEYRFGVLVSLMLSSQTKDAVVGAAVRAMKADGVLTIQAISQMEPETLKKYIEKVGFYNNKTKYIKETVEILIAKYDSDLPRTAAEMIQDLPGVGPKMAFICEGAAWKTFSGIGVDTHMHRLFNLLHWTKSRNPEQTRIQLESWLPKSHWADVNLLWVGFGQEVQQEKEKILCKALQCSRPKEALQLLKRCQLDYRKVAKECNIDLQEIDKALASQQRT
jgi:endonuclease III